MHFDPLSDPMLARDALDLGLTARRLRGPDLVTPTRGVRIGLLRHEADPRAALVDSLRLLARRDQFFSHTTAARLHGMPLPARLDDGPIHLASPTRTVRVRRKGVVGHRIKAEVVEVGGVRVESIADTFVHLGTSVLSLPELVEVGDWIVHPKRERRLTTADLLLRAREFAGARGMAAVFAAVPLIRVGADSPGETRTRLLLRRAGLPELTLQHQVRDGSGRLVGTLDLAYPDRLVGIEYEGAHHMERSQFTYDIARYARLEALGWRVIRVTHDDILDRGQRILPLVRAARARSGQ